MEDGLYDVEEHLDSRGNHTAAATEQVLDCLLWEGGDGDTSVEGVLSVLHLPPAEASMLVFVSKLSKLSHQVDGAS